jgi:hypothetical protein
MAKDVSFPMLPPKVSTLYNSGYPLHKAMSMVMMDGGSKPMKKQIKKKSGRKR